MLFSPQTEIVVPLPLFASLFLGICVVLYGLLLAPSATLPTRTKQILSIPFLTTLLVLPVKFHSRVGGFDLISSALGIAIWLRTLDLIWITPLREGTDAYISWDQLRQELWAPMRRRPMGASKKHDDEGDDDAKWRERTRSSWSLLPLLLLNY
ncbi:hypothetical protein BC938DRAFT_475548, partial [Jimgerdemannia flammicorona]